MMWRTGPYTRHPLVAAVHGLAPERAPARLALRRRPARRRRASAHATSRPRRARTRGTRTLQRRSSCRASRTVAPARVGPRTCVCRRVHRTLATTTATSASTVPPIVARSTGASAVGSSRSSASAAVSCPATPHRASSEHADDAHEHRLAGDEDAADRAADVEPGLGRAATTASRRMPRARASRRRAPWCPPRS